MAQGNPYTSESNNAVNDLREKATDSFERVADNMEGAMKSMQERGREMGDNVQQVAGNFKTAVDSSIKDQPMATLALAAAVGFVLGAIWKS